MRSAWVVVSVLALIIMMIIVATHCQFLIKELEKDCSVMKKSCSCCIKQKNQKKLVFNTFDG